MSPYAVEQALVGCPYCGEAVELPIDAPPGRHDLVEDCPVCCRPMHVVIEVDIEGEAAVTAAREDEA